MVMYSCILVPLEQVRPYRCFVRSHAADIILSVVVVVVIVVCARWYIQGTPTRSSFYSGRLPIHVLTVLSSPCDQSGAIPRNMTGIAAVLKKGGKSSQNTAFSRLLVVLTRSSYGCDYFRPLIDDAGRLE